MNKRILALLLSAAMLAGLMPATVYAENGAENACTHTHDATCGYVEGVAASPCAVLENHQHDIDCGWAEAVEGVACSVEAAHITHDSTCGGNPETGEGCTFAHTHDEACGYVEAKAAVPCAVEAAHTTHDENCGYAEAIEAVACTHECELCVQPQVRMGPLSLSSDASLLKVAGYTITPGSETGADAASAITAAISVPNATLSIAASDLVVADKATASLYDDAGFSNEATVTLTDGVNELYIKVTSEDGTTLYYHVTVTRVDGNAPVITTTQADIPYAMQGIPYGYGQSSVYIIASGSPTSYTLTGTLPAGLIRSSGTQSGTNTLIIFGTPTAIGKTTLRVTATNANGTSAPFEFTLEVRDDDRHTIGFGGKEWLVTGGTATQLTLLQKSFVSGETTKYSSNNINSYNGSDLQAAMDVRFTALGPEEAGLILSRKLAGGSGNQGTATYDDDHIAGAEVTGAHFWPLSVKEANALTIYERPYGYSWWLRSPGSSNRNAAVVGYNGSVNATGNLAVLYDLGVRPAFYLNLQSVLFTSAAAGGKSGAAGPALVAAQPPANFYKFTMTTTDTSFLNLAVTDQSARIAPQGGSVTIPYTGAQTAANKFVSCVITNPAGDVLYYGKLATAASGNAIISIPVNMPTGSYTIKLFNEQINGDNFTDFASTPISLSLTVKPNPAINDQATGTDTITLTEGYATYTKAYTIAGDPTPSVSIDGTNTANASVSAAGELTISTGLTVAGSPYTTTIKASNTHGDATMTVTVNVTDKPTYALDVSAGAGGTVSGTSSGRYTASTSITVTAAPGSGYSFTGWTASGVTVSNTPTISFNMPANDVTLTASFTRNTDGNPDPGSDSDSGSDPGPTYEYRTITDPVTGVSVKGYFTPGTTLTVTEKALHPAGTCAACDEIRSTGGWVALYDVSITGQHSGNIELRLPVDSKYNGQSMTVWHCKRGHVEKLSGTAKDGVVAITVSSLSPFAVFTAGNHNPSTGGLPDDAAVDVPQTGDNSNMGGWIALLTVSLLMMGLAVWQLLKMRGAARR